MCACDFLARSPRPFHVLSLWVGVCARACVYVYVCVRVRVCVCVRGQLECTWRVLHLPSIMRGKKHLICILSRARTLRWPIYADVRNLC